MWPILIILGFRAHFCYKYPDLTRKLARFAFYYYMFLIFINLSGQIFLICNTLIYHYNESIHISFVIIMILCIFVWIYDDYALLKALRSFSKLKYELVLDHNGNGDDVEMNKTDITVTPQTIDSISKSG